MTGPKGLFVVWRQPNAPDEFLLPHGTTTGRVSLNGLRRLARRKGHEAEVVILTMDDDGEITVKRMDG